VPTHKTGNACIVILRPLLEIIVAVENQ
jgi:hypothetical protein